MFLPDENVANETSDSMISNAIRTSHLPYAGPLSEASRRHRHNSIQQSADSFASRILSSRVAERSSLSRVSSRRSRCQVKSQVKSIYTMSITIDAVFQLGIFLRALCPARTVLRTARFTQRPDQIICIKKKVNYFFNYFLLFTKCNCCFCVFKQPM